MVYAYPWKVTPAFQLFHSFHYSFLRCLKLDRMLAPGLASVITLFNGLRNFDLGTP
jgi:hypothetical protein